MNRHACKVVTFTIVVFALLASLPFMDASAGEETRNGLILRVGAQDDMKSRNILAVSDVWSRNVHFPVYSTVALFAPETEELLPYILKGIDADDDGIFELAEHGEFSKQGGSNTRVVTAYYDFNGVYFHDGVQATMDDLLFSYHLFALDPYETSLEALQDVSGQEGSNYSTTRWLWVYPADDVWDTKIFVGEDDELTFALRFELQENYSGFSEHTLGEMIILPRHLWEGTGKVCRESANGACRTWEEDIHGDFKSAYNPITHNGVPASDPDAFRFSMAESWLMEDDEVIGTGPFVFSEWTPGVNVRLTKYEDFYADARDRNESKFMHQPYTDGIRFNIYKTVQAAVFALQAGEIDVISWPVPPEFIYSPFHDPNVGVSISVGDRFAYLGYDMRKSPFGYLDNDPSNGDDGLHLRKAIAHLIDRERIVTVLLWNFGFPGDQLVYPGDDVWYNESVPKYNYDLDAARQILDDHYTVGGLALGYGQSGYRNLPSIGEQEVRILCVQADYDPIRSQACIMIAADMREVGINAHSRSHSILEPQVFEMWMTEQTRPSDIVEFYYATFHSSNAGKGNLLPGFKNETFDSVIEEAREELDISKRIRLVKQCSGVLADTLPYDVVYFRANVEIYRKDRFVNWTVGRTGSIFGESFWSLIGVHPPLKRNIALTLSSPSAIVSSGTGPIKASVRDLSGVVVPGVKVEVCIENLTFHESGNLVLGDVKEKCLSLRTDVNGALVMGYEAPDIGDLDSLSVRIVASVKDTLWIIGEVSTFITIYPKGKEFLSVRIVMETGDVVTAGESALVNLEITDQDQSPLSGVVVNLESLPTGLRFDPSGGTTVDGSIGRVLVTAPSEMPGYTDLLTFTIHATAELEGYEPGSQRAELVVLTPEPSPVLSDFATQWRMCLVAVMLGAVVVLAVIKIAARSTREGPGKNRKI